MADINHARAVRIVDADLARFLSGETCASAWLRLIRLWFEWSAMCAGPRWPNPGVILTRDGFTFTESDDGTGSRVCFGIEQRDGSHWLVERVNH